MPKITVNYDLFSELLGQRLSPEELKTLLPVAKAEYDGQQEQAVTFELNDTNRPDLWSCAGLARQLSRYQGKESRQRNFLSSSEKTIQSDERMIAVDARLCDIRPFIVAFVATGPALTDAMLREIIQSQEKLCWNYGRRRRTIAMGIYRSTGLKWPIRYDAADPDKTRFTPLGMSQSLSLREILERDPTGKEYGHIIADLSLFPYLQDASGNALSLPPIINSADIGAVVVGDSELFVELTGDSLPALFTAANIVACDFHDFGYHILPVTIRYQYDTPFGRTITTPYHFQRTTSAPFALINRLLGRTIAPTEAKESLLRMGITSRVIDDVPKDGAEPKEPAIEADIPCYRNDFLHAVDVVEEIMIGAGLDSFAPEQTNDYTIGRLIPSELFIRRIVKIMVGLGYQEMLFSYLNSRKNLIDRMRSDIALASDEDREPLIRKRERELIRIANPMSESSEYIRNSALPNLLSAEATSSSAPYPHAMFETGKIAVPAAEQNYGSKTINSLAFMLAKADFNSVNSHVSALFYYLGLPYQLRSITDDRFIPGRVAEIVSNDNPRGRSAGIFGEIHPAVLEQWAIQTPCAAAEIDIDELMNK